MRHRYEGVESRIISPRKIKGTGGRGIEDGLKIVTKQPESHDEIQKKMEDLKLKLSEKRKNAINSVKISNQIWRSKVEKTAEI